MTAIAGMLLFVAAVVGLYLGLGYIWDNLVAAFERLERARCNQDRPVGHWDRDYHL